MTLQKAIEVAKRYDAWTVEEAINHLLWLYRHIHPWPKPGSLHPDEIKEFINEAKEAGIIFCEKCEFALYPGDDYCYMCTRFDQLLMGHLLKPVAQMKCEDCGDKSKCYIYFAKERFKDEHGCSKHGHEKDEDSDSK